MFLRPGRWTDTNTATTAPTMVLRQSHTRVEVMIQLVSQVSSPSTENACSHRAVVALTSDQMNRHRTGRPSCWSSA